MATIYGANSVSGYDVANSVRLNSGDSPYMHKVKSSNDEVSTATFSAWVKRSKLGANQRIVSHMTNGFADYFYFRFNSSDVFEFAFKGSANNIVWTTNRLFRDVSAWYHIVARVDTTDGTAGNRVRIYVNGVQETSFSASTNPDQNETFSIGTTSDPIVVGGLYGSGYGISSGSTSEHFGGYIAELVVCEGQSLAPTSFGEFDEDSPTIWRPIDVSGLTFGTNGFYLDFEDSSNLGNDANGGTDLTEANIAATDQSIDTCTNNFATLNSTVLLTDVTLSEGNLKAAFGSASARSPAGATLAPTSGKWYYELKLIASSTGNYIAAGYADIYANGTQLGNYTTAGSLGFGINAWDGTVVNRTSTTTASPGNFAITPNDILGVYLDIDNLQHTFTLNGTQHSTGYDAITASTTGFYIATIGDGGGSQTISAEINFGSPPFAISSSNTDANGYGNFEYSPTIGGVNFYALNSKNLAEFG